MCALFIAKHPDINAFRARLIFKPLSILTKLTDNLYKKQKALEIIAIFLFFTLIVFRFDNSKVQLLWSDYPFIAVALALTTALIAIIWLRIEKQKTQFLINNLQNKGNDESTKMQQQLGELSGRQRDVFNLILQGKTNKEITSALHIELSTLKTHINQIYKILGISSRKETKNFAVQSEIKE